MPFDADPGLLMGEDRGERSRSERVQRSTRVRFAILGDSARR
jgi:hypothetical protein